MTWNGERIPLQQIKVRGLSHLAACIQPATINKFCYSMLRLHLSWKKKRVDIKIAGQQIWTTGLSWITVRSLLAKYVFAESLSRPCRMFLCFYWQSAYPVLTQLDMWSPKNVKCWQNFVRRKAYIIFMQMYLLSTN